MIAPIAYPDHQSTLRYRRSASWQSPASRCRVLCTLHPILCHIRRGIDAGLLTLSATAVPGLRRACSF